MNFFSSLDIILKRDAIISLAVPDKRFCFDYFKPVSMTSDFLCASAHNARRHTKKTAFENIAYNVRFNDGIAWGQHPVCNFKFLSSLLDAKKAFDQTDDSQDAAYVDYHAWYFTPESFKLIIFELNYLGFVRWLLDVDFPTVGCEFFATLKKGRVEAESEAQLSKMRLELMQGIVNDLKVQGGYLVEGLENACPIAAADNLAVDGTLAEVTRMLAVLDSKQAELMLLIQKQDARIDKILEIARIFKKIIHPIRSVSRLRRR